MQDTTFMFPTYSKRQNASSSCVHCPSHLRSIFCHTDTGLAEKLEKQLQSRFYPRGSVLFLEHQEARVVYCISSGRVKLASSGSNGKEAIASLIGPGSILGARDILLGTPHDLTATIVQDSQICTLPKDCFLETLQQSPEISIELARQMGKELSEIYRKFSMAVCRPVPQRLAELLLSLCRTHGEPTSNGIHLRTNLNQEEMSELLGVSRRSLNRALAELRTLGLVRCSRRSILIPDSRLLCDWLAVNS